MLEEIMSKSLSSTLPSISKVSMRKKPEPMILNKKVLGVLQSGSMSNYTVLEDNIIVRITPLTRMRREINFYSRSGELSREDMLSVENDELEILYKLRGPYIIDMLGVHHSVELRCNLSFFECAIRASAEYYGEYDTYATENSNPLLFLQQRDVIILGICVVRALMMLRTMEIRHGDVKPENILSRVNNRLVNRLNDIHKKEQISMTKEEPVEIAFAEDTYVDLYESTTERSWSKTPAINCKEFFDHKCSKTYNDLCDDEGLLNFSSISPIKIPIEEISSDGFSSSSEMQINNRFSNLEMNNISSNSLPRGFSKISSLNLFTSKDDQLYDETILLKHRIFVDSYLNNEINKSENKYDICKSANDISDSVTSLDNHEISNNITENLIASKNNDCLDHSKIYNFSNDYEGIQIDSNNSFVKNTKSLYDTCVSNNESNSPDEIQNMSHKPSYEEDNIKKQIIQDSINNDSKLDSLIHYSNNVKYKEIESEQGYDLNSINKTELLEINNSENTQSSLDNFINFNTINQLKIDRSHVLDSSNENYKINTEYNEYINKTLTESIETDNIDTDICCNETVCIWSIPPEKWFSANYEKWGSNKTSIYQKLSDDIEDNVLYILPDNKLDSIYEEGNTLNLQDPYPFKASFALADFGSSRPMSKNCVIGPGTTQFYSPERILRSDGGELDDDTWALSVSLWVLSKGPLPFAGSMLSLERAILNGKLPEYSTDHRKEGDNEVISQELDIFLRKCLSTDRQLRPSLISIHNELQRLYQMSIDLAS